MLIKHNNQRTQWSCVLRMIVYTVIPILYGHSHENVTCFIRPDIRYTEIHVVKYYYLSPSRETTPLIRLYYYFLLQKGIIIQTIQTEIYVVVFLPTSKICTIRQKFYQILKVSQTVKNNLTEGRNLQLQMYMCTIYAPSIFGIFIIIFIFKVIN